MAQLAKKEYTLGFSPYEYPGSIRPFNSLFKKQQNIQKEGFEGVDAVILWGGTDIHPSIYKDVPHVLNGASTLMSARDVFEYKTVLYCKANDIPMIGICRGAQLLCAMAGGTLAQDVTGHGMSHMLETYNGKYIQTTSVHHQMMNPYNIEHKMLAWAEKPLSKKYDNGEGKTIKELAENNEPEIVYFPQLRGLAIQGHPEYSYATPGFTDFCLAMVMDCLLPPF